MVLENCLVCDSAESNLLYGSAKDYVTDERFSVRQCASCGLVFTAPSPQVTNHYYPSTYRRYGGASMALLKWLYLRRARSWLRTFSGPGFALEVGCGNGWMLRAIKQRGWTVTGTERNFESAAYAKSASEIPMFVGGLEALQAKPTFDLIFLFQVLEHLPDPLGTLKQCASLLKPNGRLIISVPNFESWQSQLFGPSWFHLDVPRHLTHFSAASLRDIALLADLTIMKIGFVSFEHDPYGWVQSGLNWLGFRQNQLTWLLMGMDPQQRLTPPAVGMLAVGALLAVPAFLLTLWSWWCNAGAVMEVWCMRTEAPD